MDILDITDLFIYWSQTFFNTKSLTNSFYHDKLLNKKNSYVDKELTIDSNTINKQLKIFEKACRKAGLKLTHQRREIFKELMSSTDHPSAETLYHRLKQRIPTISLDTIYRTLATFNIHGMAQKVETVYSQARFEVTYKHHHHLICKKCNEIIDFFWPLIERSSLPAAIKAWGKIDNKNVIVHGICNKCLKSK